MPDNFVSVQMIYNHLIFRIFKHSGSYFDNQNNVIYLTFLNQHKGVSKHIKDIPLDAVQSNLKQLIDKISFANKVSLRKSNASPTGFKHEPLQIPISNISTIERKNMSVYFTICSNLPRKYIVYN